MAAIARSTDRLPTLGAVRRRLLILSILIVAVLTVATAPARAHTEVQRATPGPGETVDEGVDELELLFLDPVLPDVTIVVSDTDGREVAGLGPVSMGDDRRTARVGFDPLDDGAYVVDFEFVAEDGDAQVDAYRFTVSGGGSASALGPVAGGVAATVAVALLAVALRRRGTTT